MAGAGAGRATVDLGGETVIMDRAARRALNRGKPHGREPMKKKVVYTVNVDSMALPGSAGTRAECIRMGPFVYLTGQAAFTLDGRLVGIGDPAAQARQAMENIKTLMEAAGGTMADVVKLLVFVTDRKYREAAYPVIRSYLTEPRPCQTGVVVKGLAREELLIEIDAWGYIDDRRRSPSSRAARPGRRRTPARRVARRR
jgi:enamine deaminase RidA (YjgF/YER057c/UK114 family)